MNLTDNRQINGRNTNFIKYFTYTGTHRKEMKLKEVVRLWGLYNILTKRVWISRNKLWKGTRKYTREPVEDKVLF